MASTLWTLASFIDVFSQGAYRKVSNRLLSRQGVGLQGSPLWVSPRVFWDVSYPGSITLGDRCVLSHYVRLLTHDFSMDRVAERMHGDSGKNLYRTEPIVIGELCFIGMGATILPGVTVGAGSIVGAGSVVSRDVGADVVVAGNPARVVSTTMEYWDKRSAGFSWSKRRR